MRARVGLGCFDSAGGKTVFFTEGDGGSGEPRSHLERSERVVAVASTRSNSISVENWKTKEQNLSSRKKLAVSVKENICCFCIFCRVFVRKGFVIFHIKNLKADKASNWDSHFLRLFLRRGKIKKATRTITSAILRKTKSFKPGSNSIGCVAQQN
ncbi:crossover junction endodeoxyribonuclease RuvC [Striga asiatica]|uniref:Crossover junction endodeoxyribonuclease RuvC n=1 Tax=Striga asiatica TaxID=4170 RepID=A0A5A7PT82_STRAF|nr:crossover junction endodeoxyribonuclease RuvC [Striga asiatica]